MTIVKFFLATLVLFSTTTYNRAAIVEKVTADVVTVVDNSGNLWEFYGDGYKVGTEVTLIMNSGKASGIKDDEIIAVF